MPVWALPALLLFLYGLDFYVDACWKIELHERVYRLLCGLENVDQTLVRADLERLAGLLVNVGRAKNAILVLHRGERDRSRDLSSGALCRLDDLARRRIQHTVVICLEANSDSLSSHGASLFLELKDRLE